MKRKRANESAITSVLRTNAYIKAVLDVLKASRKDERYWAYSADWPFFHKPEMLVVWDGDQIQPSAEICYVFLVAVFETETWLSSSSFVATITIFDSDEKNTSTPTSATCDQKHQLNSRIELWKIVDNYVKYKGDFVPLIYSIMYLKDFTRWQKWEVYKA